MNIPIQSPECLHEIYHKQGMPQWKCQVVVIGQRMRSNIYFKHASNISTLFGWLTFVITWNETMKMKSIHWNIFTIFQLLFLKHWDKCINSPLFGNIIWKEENINIIQQVKETIEWKTFWVTIIWWLKTHISV